MSEASGLFRTKVLTTGRYNLGSPNTKSQVSDNAALLCPYSPKNFVQVNIRLTDSDLRSGADDGARGCFLHGLLAAPGAQDVCGRGELGGVARV